MNTENETKPSETSERKCVRCGQPASDSQCRPKSTKDVWNRHLYADPEPVVYEATSHRGARHIVLPEDLRAPNTIEPVTELVPLLPCPFCGGSDLEPYAGDTAVICSDCHAHGPLGALPGSALWNRRAGQSPAESPSVRCSVGGCVLGYETETLSYPTICDAHASVPVDGPCVAILSDATVCGEGRPSPRHVVRAGYYWHEFKPAEASVSEATEPEPKPSDDCICSTMHCNRWCDPVCPTCNPRPTPAQPSAPEPTTRGQGFGSHVCLDGKRREYSPLLCSLCAPDTQGADKRAAEAIARLMDHNVELERERDEANSYLATCDENYKRVKSQRDAAFRTVADQKAQLAAHMEWAIALAESEFGRPRVLSSPPHTAIEEGIRSFREEKEAARRTIAELRSQIADGQLHDISKRLAELKEIAASSDSYVPQDVAAELLMMLRPLNMPGKPNSLLALTERAMATIAELTADRDGWVRACSAQMQKVAEQDATIERLGSAWKSRVEDAEQSADRAWNGGVETIDHALLLDAQQCLAIADRKNGEMLRENDRLMNDLADALDLRNGVGPTVLTALVKERDGLREAANDATERLASAEQELGRWKFVPDDNGGHMLSVETGDKWYPESFTSKRLSSAKERNRKLERYTGHARSCAAVTCDRLGNRVSTGKVCDCGLAALLAEEKP